MRNFGVVALTGGIPAIRTLTGGVPTVTGTLPVVPAPAAPPEDGD